MTPHEDKRSIMGHKAQLLQKNEAVWLLLDQLSVAVFSRSISSEYASFRLSNKKLREITTRDVIPWQNEMLAYRDPVTGMLYSRSCLKTIINEAKTTPLVSNSGWAPQAETRGNTIGQKLVKTAVTKKESPKSRCGATTFRT